MEIDEADMDEGSSSDDDDENDSEEVKALKVIVSTYLSILFAKGSISYRLAAATSRTSWLLPGSPLPLPHARAPALARSRSTTVPR